MALNRRPTVHYRSTSTNYYKDDMTLCGVAGQAFGERMHTRASDFANEVRIVSSYGEVPATCKRCEAYAR